jgi:hypothetical protein
MANDYTIRQGARVLARTHGLDLSEAYTLADLHGDVAVHDETNHGVHIATVRWCWGGRCEVEYTEAQREMDRAWATAVARAWTERRGA